MSQQALDIRFYTFSTYIIDGFELIEMFILFKEGTI